MIAWIFTNIVAIGVFIALATFLVSFVALCFSAYRFVTTKRDAQLQIDFENYHKLIAQLVGSQRDTETMKLYSQVAIVYELQRFHRYKAVTVRILEGLRSEWSSSDKDTAPLIKEMDIAIAKLK